MSGPSVNQGGLCLLAGPGPGWGRGEGGGAKVPTYKRAVEVPLKHEREHRASVGGLVGQECLHTLPARQCVWGEGGVWST
jgi:hypothetical protein